LGDRVAAAAVAEDAGSAVAASGADRPAFPDRTGAGDAAPAGVAGKAAEGETTAETEGKPEAEGPDADGRTRESAVTDGLGEGARNGLGVRAGRGDGDSVADGDGSGKGAGADAAAGIVAATVGDTATSPSAPRFPNIDSPAPITNPRTTTPIRIGSSGRDGPGGGVGLRVLRGGEPCIARVFEILAARASRRAGSPLSP